MIIFSSKLWLTEITIWLANYALPGVKKSVGLRNTQKGQIIQ